MRLLLLGVERSIERVDVSSHHLGFWGLNYGVVWATATTVRCKCNCNCESHSDDASNQGSCSVGQA
jgi:hypothetical protein